MVKAYLRYEALASFGVVTSTLSNICYDKTGKLAITPALEEVLVWDLRKGVQVSSRSSVQHDNLTLFLKGWQVARIRKQGCCDLHLKES